MGFLEGEEVTIGRSTDRVAHGQYALKVENATDVQAGAGRVGVPSVPQLTLQLRRQYEGCQNQNPDAAGKNNHHPVMPYEFFGLKTWLHICRK